MCVKKQSIIDYIQRIRFMNSSIFDCVNNPVHSVVQSKFDYIKSKSQKIDLELDCIEKNYLNSFPVQELELVEFNREDY